MSLGSLRSRRRLGALALAGSAALSTALTLVPATGAQAVDDGFVAQLVTVDTPTRGDKERLQKLGLDLTEHAGRDYVEAVLHTPLDRDLLERAGFGYDVRIPDLFAREAHNNAVNAAYAASTVRSALPSGRVEYRTLADYEADMAALAERKPKVARTFTLPLPSLDGRTITGIEIAGKVRRAATDGRPVFVLMGLHHAREWPSGELAMEFAVDLVKGYGRDDRITRALDRAAVIVVPVVNVDGFHLSRTDGGTVDLRELDGGGLVSNLATANHAYKRKNCRVVDGQDTPDGTCALTLGSPGGFGLGVDLNRNYGGFWGGPGASGPTPDAEANTGLVDPTYRGAAPFSEPETRNIQELVSGRQVTMLISNHTYGNLILRPNGVHPDTIGPDGLPVGDAPDEKQLKSLGARMADANGYANTHGWELYDTTGTTEDWSYNATGGFGYTFEIGPDEFHPPFPSVVDEYVGAGAHEGHGNREAFLVALEAAADRDTHSVIKGRAPKGAVLRLTKSFESPTWESSFEDHLESRLKSRGGRFVWHVNPSTRPVVQEKVVETVAGEAVRVETYEGGATAPNETVDHEFTLTERGADVLRVELDWPLPDDFDLEVYRREGTELVAVGSSGNLPGEKESVDVEAVLGDYVLRVVNYAAASPTYTLTATVLEETVTEAEVVPGKVERWTLTCEKKGKVLQTVKVRVDRGRAAKVNLGVCARRW